MVGIVGSVYRPGGGEQKGKVPERDKNRASDSLVEQRPEGRAVLVLVKVE